MFVYAKEGVCERVCMSVTSSSSAELARDFSSHDSEEAESLVLPPSSMVVLASCATAASTSVVGE